MGSINDILASGNMGPSSLDIQAQQAGIAHSQAATAGQQAVTQGTQLQNRVSERELRDQDIMQRAMANTNGDPLAVKQYAVKNGVSAPGYFALQNHIATAQTAAAKLTQEQLANESAVNGQTGNILQAVNDAAPDQRPAAWANALPQLQKMQPGYQWGNEVPTDAQLKFHLGTHGFTGKLLEQEKEKAATEASNATAAKTVQETAATAKEQGVQELQAITDPNTGMPSPEAYAAWKQKHPEIVAPDMPVKGFISSLTRSTVPVKDQPEFDIKTNQANAMKGITPQAIEQRVGTAVDPKQYPEEYARTLSAAKNAVADGMTMKEVEAAIKDGGDRIGRLQAGVAQAKATAPTKISIMQAGVAAKAASAVPGQDALDLMAEDALAGKSPSSRNPVLYAKVYERAAEIAKARGMDAQGTIMARNSAQAAHGAFTAVTKQYETLKPFAEMAEKNANVLEGAAAKVSDMGGSFFNTPLRDMQSKFGGNTNVAAFRAALLPVQADFARILNSPTGAGVLSDSAREEMGHALGEGATPGQIRTALNIFRQDARNRKETYEAQIEDLKHKTVSGGTATPKPAAASSAAQKLPTGHSVNDVVTVKGGKKIKITAVHPDGTFDGVPQ